MLAVLAILTAVGLPRFIKFIYAAQSAVARHSMVNHAKGCARQRYFSTNYGGLDSVPGYISSLPGSCLETATYTPEPGSNNPTYIYDPAKGVVQCFYGSSQLEYPSCIITAALISENADTVETVEPKPSIIQLTSGNASGNNFSCNGEFYTERGSQNESWGLRDQQYRVNSQTGERVMITATKDGTASTGDSQTVKDLSCDGRYALFELDEYGSVDIDGLPGADGAIDDRTGLPANDRGALYRKDLETGEVIRVDTLSDGTKMRNKWSIREATMTSDGRFAIFETPDVQLAGLEEAKWESDDWSRTLAYRKDLKTGELSTVVTKPDGSPGDGWTSSGGYGNGVSSDGSKVTFIYRGDDLVPGVSGTNVYVKDFIANKVSLVSSDTQGNQLSGFGNFGSGSSISADGSKVVFTSQGSAGGAQLMMKDLESGALSVISKSNSGAEGNGYSGGGGFQFSENNKYVVYESSASNLTSNDTNGKYDIFVYDVSSGKNKRILDDKANGFDDHLRDPRITADGKYITFTSRSKGIASDAESSGNNELYMVESPFFSE
ncbi:PD40 domain-containing protein [Synechococcus sp. BL107]|uniref:PD40 domain-containing protein n=1 Tax=Synechococcus sp. BL107 TaxID=313625 RepID=UPI0018DCBBCF|nr:PD40 domain-containing protein [Synechococcus sp. BL107]